MNKIQKQVKEFMEAVGQEMPDKPLQPKNSIRHLRVRLLLEELLEFTEASGVGIYHNSDALNPVSLKDFYSSDNGSVDLVEIADALADINYVSYGAANQYGLDLEPFEEEVHKNNMTKLIDGYRDETGKFRKGPSYKSVDLRPILEAQLT